VYEKKISRAFERSMPDIMNLIKYNGLTTRSHDDFESYFTQRTMNIFEGVIADLKRNYDDSIMPIPLADRLAKVDMEKVLKLGLKVFRRAREHRVRYEDRIKTIEKEEIAKMEEIKRGK
jgi:hypothetical protein